LPQPSTPSFGEDPVAALTKAQIAENLVAKNPFNRRDAVQVVEALFELMKQTLEQGEDLLISGFGKFSVNGKNQRRGRNPQTGEAISLAPRRVVTFKCSSKLREQVNR
jgi:integration host factor subunit alpha